MNIRHTANNDSGFLSKKLFNYSEIPCSSAALTAFMFAVPLILYICEFEPKLPMHEVCIIQNYQISNIKNRGVE